MPSVSFYNGVFRDGAMDVIEGYIERNRDLVPPEDGSPPVIVRVGTFRMEKVAAKEYF